MNILQRLKSAAAVGLTLLSPLFATDASAAPPASFTTVNSVADGSGHCFNGGDPSDSVNCNIYDGKKFVWLNGGPVASWGGAGQYFFAVMIPSGQGNPNDGSGSLLSFDDTVDPFTNRTFTLDAAGNVTAYSGTHDRDGTRIRLGVAPDWYETTTNNGGEYIIAVCKMPDTQPVRPSACKYDAFKLVQVEPPPPPPCPCGERDPETQLCPATCPCECGYEWNGTQCVFIKECVTITNPHLSIMKSAAGSYKQIFGWDIVKERQGDAVRYLLSGSVTVPYKLTITKSESIQDVTVSGEILIINDGDAASNSNVVEDTLIAPLTGDCTVSDSFTSIPVDPNGVAGTYSCTLPNQLPAANPGVNHIEVEYAITNQDNTPGSAIASWEAAINFTATVVGSPCAALDDLWVKTGVHSAPNGVSEVCESGTVEYSRTIPVASGCVVYDNTASVTPAEGSGDSASATVQVCGPVNSGAHTMGYWQNKNGQGQIKGAGNDSETGNCKVYETLAKLAPFGDIKSITDKSCTGTAAWVYSVIKSASAGSAAGNMGAMNLMLKAQMLASTLSSYFTPGVNAFQVDLTKVWFTQDTRAAFSASGTENCKTVPELIAYASTTNYPFNTSVTPNTWYNQNKGMQGLAKNTFDAINNQQVFECPH
jgi:hypothetical protein